MSVTQTAKTFFVVAMHPVAQGLAVHPACPGGARAIRPVNNKRKRQNSPRRRPVLLPQGRHPQARSREIQP